MGRFCLPSSYMNDNIFYDEYLIVDYIESALTRCDNVVRKGLGYNFRCNVCGDSQKSKKKRRGHILKNKKGIWIFNCFNCSTGMGATFWLKKFFPEEYSSYIKAVLSKKTPENKTKFKFKEEPIKIVKKVPKYPFIPITSIENKKILEDAQKVCIDRKIPEQIWKKFYVCDESPKSKEEIDYKGRMIIPFYRNCDNKIYYFSGRSLYGQEPKYKGAPGEKKIYNIYNVDKSKPVIILEGMIDSMFVDNSVALVGLQFGDDFFDKIKDIQKPYFLLDSDAPGRKKASRLLKEGNFVFNWRAFLKDNGLYESEKYDINQVYLLLNRERNFEFEELEKYFTNSYRDIVWYI